MRRSHPTSFVLKKRDSCAVCNNIAPCPACPQGQQCQQIFRSSCQDCPVNKCVPIPGYSSGGGSNKSALGGGLAALFIVAIGAAFAFWFWKRLVAKRRRQAIQQEALERREKVRNEKEATTLQLGGAKSNGDIPNFAIVDTDELDNDTEYTQVTGVLNNNGEGDSLGSLAEPTAFRRRSFGAATHLSRITEGVEEEEEDEQGAIPKGNRRNTIGSVKSAGARSFASGAGPRVSIGSGISSVGSHNIIPIAFKPSSAPADADRFSDAYQPAELLPLPSTAHRATGAPVIAVNSARSGPIRPTRAPDLDLRLPDTPQKHQPTRSSPLASSANTSTEPAYDFMSIDPVETLAVSGPYSRSDRHLSAATINTIGSTHSGSLSYVLSAPQVITPVSGEGVRRVQLGNGGKAQLVRGGSLKRNKASTDADPFRDATAEEDDNDPLPLPSKPFASNGTSGDRSSAISTSTLGIPFGENPFGPSPFPSGPANQVSPSDAEERSSWLGEMGENPFDDPGKGQSTDSSTQRGSLGGLSIGGLSLLGQFPFDFEGSKDGEQGPKRTQMPSGTPLRQVEQHK